MKVKTSDQGIEVVSQDFVVLFGNRNLDRNQIPHLKIKQTHSDIVVPASSELCEADAHYTETPQTKLAIFTADCAPIMIYSSDIKFIAAVHAGWRGVANQILVKTINKLRGLGSLEKNIKIVIGPHIQQQSFEVGKDVAKEILLSVPFLTKQDMQRVGWRENEEKMQLDLNQILLHQLAQAEINSENILNFKIDTKLDLSWHSHRRDKENSGRNMSLIWKT